MNQHPNRGDVAGPAVDEVVVTADPQVAAAAEAVREITRHLCAVHAEKLRHIAELAALTETVTRRVLAASPRVSGQPDDLTVIDAAVTARVQAALSSSAFEAGWMLDLARRLTGLLTGTMSALEEGRLDLDRARVLSEATTVCSDAVARQVEATVLPVAGRGPGESLSSQEWRARIKRAVVEADLARSGSAG
jgi:hypothetical protein